MFFFRYILWPFSILYGFILFLRNRCYDLTILKVHKTGVPIISVGNLSVGGTGKTPHVAYIANFLKEDTKVAILLRGYGRSTNGYLLVTNNATVETVGDEALFYKKTFKDEVLVAVSEDRVNGVKQLKKQFPSLGVVLLDDAYQHRKIYRDLDILLVDYNKPFWKDMVLPAGRLREFPHGKKRADLVVMTKCPEKMSPETLENKVAKMRLNSMQTLLFSSIQYGVIRGFQSVDFELPDHILLVTGIANSKPLENHLSKLAKVTHKVYGDHHDFTEADIKEVHELFDTFVTEKKAIVTTQKDFMRLNTPQLRKLTQQYPWFYQEIKVVFNEEEIVNKLIKKSIC